MESDDFVAAVNGVGALAEPARRRLYLYAATQAEPVSREQAAAGAGYVELMRANLATLRLGLGCK